jgi:hypothetical protein
MSTNVKTLGKGLKQLALLLFLFILSPIILNIGFKAVAKPDEIQPFFGYGILVLATLLILFSIYFAFKTFNTLLNALFDSSK